MNSQGPDPSEETREVYFTKRPLYAVLFDSGLDPAAPYQPYIVADTKASMYDKQTSLTVPHGLSKEMAAALPCLWYCLHLPNIFAQFFQIPCDVLQSNQTQPCDHQFFFAPVQIFNKEYVPEWPPWAAPALTICPDHLMEQVTAAARTLGFRLPAIGYSQLSDEKLRSHWRALQVEFAPELPYLDVQIQLTQRLDLAATSLPARWITRQLLGDTSEDLAADPKRLIDQARFSLAIVAVTADLEHSKLAHTSPHSSTSAPTAIELSSLRVPVSLALPGVAAAYTRRVYSAATRSRIRSLTATNPDDTWATDLADRPDSMVERAVIELLTAHRALARTGIGLMLPSVPQEAFIALAELERHFRTTPNAASVWRLLDRLNDAAKSIWSGALVDAVASASNLTVFSNFPIGLLTYPGDSSPLCTRVPIAYRPLNPLSRAMQSELTYVPPFDLSQGYRVLVAECISGDDPVGAVSRIGWESGYRLVRDGSYRMEFEIVEVPSIERLNAAITEYNPHVLVVSAHGVYLAQAGLAGLRIGEELCLGPELVELPPIVIMSACHVAPRGAGPVTITDLILRQGARAVLGTQVPVDVRRNAILMTRLFIYLAETLARSEGFTTLLDAWHHVQASNAIYDVLNGSRALNDFGLSPDRLGITVLAEFLGSRSAGRLRRGNIYVDTERVLSEIADDRGVGDSVRNWFQRPGYVPESLFYVFAGAPEKIFLRHPASF